MTKRLKIQVQDQPTPRREFVGKTKSPVNAREYGPGVHGQRRRKPTDYGTQLMAKQKLKGYYGNISEKQFHRITRKRFDEAETPRKI